MDTLYITEMYVRICERVEWFCTLTKFPLKAFTFGEWSECLIYAIANWKGWCDYTSAFFCTLWVNGSGFCWQQLALWKSCHCTSPELLVSTRAGIFSFSVSKKLNSMLLNPALRVTYLIDNFSLLKTDVKIADGRGLWRSVSAYDDDVIIGCFWFMCSISKSLNPR